ncbi:MAG TPA: phospholipase D-like domain-containing protein [Candidatus Dormibacteraeota bacterium]
MRRLALGLLLLFTAGACVPAAAAGLTPTAPGLHRDAEIFNRVDALLAGRPGRVWVEMYEFGRADLEARLIQLHEAGCDVRVITDPSVDVSRGAAAVLVAGGVPVRYYPIDDSVHQIDHVKLLIADGAALVGGMNWGATSWRNHDYALDVGEPADVQRLATIYAQDWALAGGHPQPLAVDPGGPLYQTAPGDEIRMRLLGLIDGATRSISAEVFVLSDPDVIAALGLAHLRGVRVRVLLDPNQDSNLASCSALRAAGVDVAWFPVAPGQKLHAKAGLFDSVLLLGSANWSVSGLSSNHELDIDTRAPSQTTAFGAWFEADWALARPWWKWWLGLAC